MGKEFDVLCVGAVNHDTIALVANLPREDQRSIAHDLVVGHGGPAAQSAVTLARLGHSVALASTVGDDPEGAAIIEGLEREGVDTRYVTTLDGARTAQTIVLANTTTGNRSIVTSPYRSMPIDPPIGSAPIVHVDQVGYSAVSKVMAKGVVGGRISMDAGNPIPGFSLHDVWLYAPTRTALARDLDARPNETDESLAARAREAGPDIVVVTDGGNGSSWYSADESIHVNAVPVNVVSSLGAGDVFHGALVSAVIDGRSPSDALLWANTCASLSCLAIDGRSGIPIRAALETAVAELRARNEVGTR